MSYYALKGTATYLMGNLTSIYPRVIGIPVFSGSGSPEGVVVGPVGSLFFSDTGGAGTTLYVKESGAGNTGWVAK